jgi:hypothetical protein
LTLFGIKRMLNKRVPDAEEELSNHQTVVIRSGNAEDQAQTFNTSITPHNMGRNSSGSGLRTLTNYSFWSML